MKRPLLDALLAARAARRAVVLVTEIQTGEQWLAHHGEAAPVALPGSVVEALPSVFRSDRSASLGDGERQFFLNVFNPPLRMILIGAVHITQPLVQIARLTGFEVSVVDPRSAWAEPARFPDVDIHSEWPDAAITELAPDARTAIVTLTHDPKLDDPALHAALASPAFYIGSLGSRKTHAARCARLQDAGFDEASVGRIRAPVGLDIGAKGPAEIAVSIVAQVVETLRVAAP